MESSPTRTAQFTAEDSLRSRWDPAIRPQAAWWFTVGGVICAVLAVLLLVGAGMSVGLAHFVAVLAFVLAFGLAAGCFVAAAALRFTRTVGALLLRFAFPIFLLGIIGIVLAAWTPALLYEVVDRMITAESPEARLVQTTFGGPLTIAELEAALAKSTPRAFLTTFAFGLWPLQFVLTRDILAMVGVVGFVSLVAMFAIWWERKVAGRMQSRLGPMRVGGWHGWAQSLADGLKLFQKEDIYLAGADRPLFRLAPYVAFIPALAMFVALPFSAAWVGRDLDVSLVFILAMFGVGVLGVLIAGWASNNKWSMFGAMREACQMISYEIPLGFGLLVPIMLAGSLRLTTLGEMQGGGFHTWLAFSNPFAFAAALIVFIATLASCKRAPFDLPEAESELVAGFHTEYSGFRWALFFFAEYAEMFAVGALAAILFFGAWHSPLPAAWGAGWEHGPLWQRALQGLLFGGPAWLIAKGFFFIYLQMWLRWTLPRIRLDQVMFACVQVMLPLSMIVLLGNTFWLLLVPPGHWLAVLCNVLLTAVGAVAVLGMVGLAVYGYSNRRRLVGTQGVDALPGA